MAAGQADFRRSYSRVIDKDEAGPMLLDYAAQFGGTWWKRWGDSRALARWLDEDALSDRYLRRRGELELDLRFLLDRFGTIVDSAIQRMSLLKDISELWERLGIESLLRCGLEYSGDRRVRTAAMTCLAKSLQSLPREATAVVISSDLSARIQRWATDPAADVWLQCRAIDALARMDQRLLRRVIRQRLTRVFEGDDLFVRRHCLRVAVEHVDDPEADADVWESVLDDPSPAVRQGLAECLWRSRTSAAWSLLIHLISNDPCHQVRAAALKHALTAVERDDLRLPFLYLLADRLKHETETFSQRTALHVAVQWLAHWQVIDRDRTISRDVQRAYESRILPAIRQLQSNATEIPCRRWAAAAAEQIWVRLDSKARTLFQRLQSRLAETSPRGSCRVPIRWLRDVDPDTVGRTLAVLAQEGFGIELVRGICGYRLVRQPRFGFRVWRAWNELWRPATDKRQAYRHTVGRILQGNVRAPSRIMGELSATKVPGEPVVVASDGTWRPFLPLVDDFVASLNQSLLISRPTRLYSSEGVTQIDVSRNPLRRFRSSVNLVRRFPAFAELRNWDASSSQRPERYLEAMQRLGFRVTFRRYEGREADSSVTQFFPALVAFGPTALWPIWKDVLEGYLYYFSSAFENTLTQLVVFTSASLVLFSGKHALSNLRISSARRRVPLSIGGWGTRGKSGTERLKAALITGTGHALVSKTTGCEAMFIYAAASGEPLEIPLYRPGDKATIWEQSNLLRMASGLRPSVFLWECMALTPDYVDVLQQQWMHDDLATITNTYPDHEDVQGPSGLDVATTITGFVPRRSHLITTEQQMAPLVHDQCVRQQSTFRSVNWLDSGLLTDDILARFPYREHPDNIALVGA